jgi:hypothetical protein
MALDKVLPPPTGEFTNLSAVELTKIVRAFTSELRTFQTNFEASSTAATKEHRAAGHHRFPCPWREDL